MSTQSNDASTLTADRPAPDTSRETRPFFWSVRRELWENRSISVAPLVVTAVVLFASLISVMSLPLRLQRIDDPAKLDAAMVRPFAMAPAPIMLATFIIGVFFCIDTLYGERRDRSILFWKSMPVSDRTTVLSKASIPFVVLPVIAFVLSVVTQLTMLVVSVPFFLAGDLSLVTLWTELGFLQGLVIMIYGLAVHVLWYAPIYGWLMVVSAWARRAPLLWAVLPLLAISAAERIVFDSWHFMNMLHYRVGGALKEAFAFKPGADGNIDRLSQLEPANFLTRPGLWIGLLFAAAFLAIAVRLRRYREPI